MAERNCHHRLMLAAHTERSARRGKPLFLSCTGLGDADSILFSAWHFDFGFEHCVDIDSCKGQNRTCGHSAPWYHWGGDYLRVVNITNVRNVTNITNITNITDIRNVHYAYKDIATTAVNRDVFAGGKPVAHSVVSIPREQLAKAQVIPHPAVNPTRSAAMAGRPVSTPTVRSAPLVASNRTNSGATRTSPEAARQPERTTSPAATSRTEAESREASGLRRSTSPPGLVTRATPPERGLSFNEMNRAMFEHPGRPLEPAQIENLRAGRPVGPMVDREFPAHIAPLPRVVPAPRSHRP